MDRQHQTIPSIIRIGIVDDELEVLQPLAAFLCHLGHDVASSDSATDTLAAIRSDPDYLDVLVTDMEMPEMHGGELIERVRAIRPNIPTIAMSGVDCWPQTADRFLHKPFQGSTLAKVIEELLGRYSEGNRVPDARAIS